MSQISAWISPVWLVGVFSVALLLSFILPQISYSLLAKKKKKKRKKNKTNKHNENEKMDTTAPSMYVVHYALVNYFS